LRPVLRPAVPLLLAAALVAACSSSGATNPPSAASEPPTSSESAPTASQPAESPSGSLTVYSGRSESLVGPLLERFEQETGIDVEVNYASTAELAATILEEGDASPADVFFGQDAGALGALAAEGLLAALPHETLDAVEARFRSPDGTWVGVSGRARVVAYDSRVHEDDDVPDEIAAFTDPAWKGKIGWAPTNASFQAFVTAFRVMAGDDAAKAWLEGIQANDPKVYDGNDAVLNAIAAGEIEVGFINHYYLMVALAEQGDSFPVRNHFLSGDDPGALVNVAGAGVLNTAANPAAAQAFVDYLLSEESQQYFATETQEYPLVAGVPANPELPPLAEIASPDIDLSDLADLEGTLRLIQEAGVL
jgi:iron(III) transport system substrate-binding protein